jgi:hypothetical protein
MYVFKFAAFASVIRSPFEATSTVFLNGIDCTSLWFNLNPTSQDSQAAEKLHNNVI